MKTGCNQFILSKSLMVFIELTLVMI